MKAKILEIEENESLLILVGNVYHPRRLLFVLNLIVRETQPSWHLTQLGLRIYAAAPSFKHTCTRRMAVSKSPLDSSNTKSCALCIM
jgi:hypothetical protein